MVGSDDRNHGRNPSLGDPPILDPKCLERK